MSSKSTMMSATNSKYRDFVLLALFAAIVLLLGFTPLGMIPLPFIKMTIIHIPVILGALLLGPKYGAVLGSLFGLVSLISNTFSPLIPLPGTANGTPLALVVCFLPRILVGVIPYYVYRAIQKVTHAKKEGSIVSLAVAGLSGALTNTIFVMALIFVLFRDAYAAAKGVPADAVLGIVLGIVGANGIPEAIGAGILVAAIGKVLFKIAKY